MMTLTVILSAVVAIAALQN